MELHDDAASSQPVDRREGFLAGGVIGAALTAATADARDAAAVLATLAGGEPMLRMAPSGRRRAAIALGDALLVELTSGGVDLRRLAQRWVTWQGDDGLDADPMLSLALDHLRQYDAPVTELAAGSVSALAAALPAAVASGSPRAMVAGAFHVARMLDPRESTALAAVALVLTASIFMEGRRDFVPDVVAALRANDAPEEVLDAFRWIPRDPRTPPPVPDGVQPDPVAVAVWLLWQAHHRTRDADVLRDLALHGGVSPTVGAITGALLGARDGMATWPARWTGNSSEEMVLRRALAGRLRS